MIRVIIERIVEEGKEVEIWELLLNLRTMAMQQPGYISGETVVGYEDPLFIMVISTWNSVEDWQAWEGNAERGAITSQIEPLLSVPEKTHVLVSRRSSSK